MTEKQEPPRRGRFAVLPRPTAIEETIASVETERAQDPEGGRDTDRDFLLRYN
ncbi:hypothetical protein [Nocardioides sp. InS609-2]|uniref:hypothetical protein n=1 Tax=Nocardioides sp. InS609-2 TaxID=2760705 RepID=UPI00182FE1AD|nr:hypothetical protein [Nocardioides sp. InS609-2]MBA3783776.1 heme biosynthesis protein HemY [Nocardioides sp.]